MSQTHRCFAGSNGPKLTGALEGRPILISYADVRSRRKWWTETMRPMLEAGAFPFVILDSGAFAVQSSGITIDIETYAAFAAAHLELFDVVVNLDSIAGDLDESRRNLETLRAAGVPAMPVFHEGEPWAELETMIAESGYVGLGFARTGPRMTNKLPARTAWLEEAFERVAGRAKVHGFAMTRHADDLPFFSVDSTTWISEYRGLRTRTPGQAYKGTHGVGGDLAARLATWTDEELALLAADSYDHDEGEAEAWAHDESRGQARTVFKRFGRFAVAALDAIEAERFRTAA